MDLGGRGRLGGVLASLVITPTHTPIHGSLWKEHRQWLREGGALAAHCWSSQLPLSSCLTEGWSPLHSFLQDLQQSLFAEHSSERHARPCCCHLSPYAGKGHCWRVLSCPMMKFPVVQNDIPELVCPLTHFLPPTLPQTALWDVICWALASRVVRD